VNDQKRQSLFAELIVRHQSELFGYIYAVVRNWEDAKDLYQAVCLTLWDKFDLFQPGSNFFAWARQTARNKVGDFIRRQYSPTHIAVELMDNLAEGPANSRNDDAETYLNVLRSCREKLSAADDELLQLRYVEDFNTVEIADRLQRHQQSVSRSLNRIRRRLFECIQVELAKRKHSSEELS
jgi:RNA polymerase sigma-70 factor, ECF subfamily